MQTVIELPDSKRPALRAAVLMRMRRKDLYRPGEIVGHYAQAWAIAHFLLAGGRPEHRKALDAYWAAIRSEAGRDDAFSAAFGALDMEEFDRDLREFTAGIR